MLLRRLPTREAQLISRQSRQLTNSPRLLDSQRVRCACHKSTAGPRSSARLPIARPSFVNPTKACGTLSEARSCHVAESTTSTKVSCHRSVRGPESPARRLHIRTALSANLRQPPLLESRAVHRRPARCLSRPAVEVSSRLQFSVPIGRVEAGAMPCSVSPPSLADDSLGACA